jgi:radical SAM superfamily enzyme YgiQ (UPF0313 family)
MKPEADLLVISPGNNRVIYQDLAREYAAVEPPIWAGLLANFARSRGHSVALIDQEGEGLETAEVARRAADLKPRLVAIVVYGQQPSASTQNMTVSCEVASAIREQAPSLPLLMLGGHPSALPEQTLAEAPVDFVCQGEGPLTVDALLQMDDLRDDARLDKVPGLWRRANGKPRFTAACPVIPEKDLPAVLPGLAWDLLPMKNYRAHNWHCFEHIHERQPYASLYTSLGCPFRCSFCCINAPFGVNTIRYWDPKFVIEQLDLLANKYGVKNIKVADEMFVLHERHVLTLCDLIIERGYDFNFWAYARVDTIKEKFLEKLKKAGFNWLCLGIESGSKHVRDGVSKGRFKEEDIRAVVERIKAAGIYIIGNYIFGLPDDDYASMQATLDLSLELNCEMANFYSGTAYPGSQLYHLAREKGWRLPAKWHDFSQHAFEQIPLPTEKISAGEVLAWRDKAWQVYFTDPVFLKLLRDKFGQDVVDHVNKLTKITLKRKHAAPLRVEPRGRAASPPPTAP